MTTAGVSPRTGGGESLRVLMVCNEWLPRHGGLPRFNKDLAAALASQNHHVDSIAFRPLQTDYKDAEAHGVRLVEPQENPNDPKDLNLAAVG